MVLKITICLIVMTLACVVTSANAEKPAPLLDRIAQSLTQIDPGWKHKSTEVYKRADASTQANIKWSNGDIERGATVIVYPSLKRARRAFRPSGKEDLQERFCIDGIGDEAFLWPPKVPQGGAYNIRFRKAQVEVWMSGGSESEIKRYALAIAIAITASNKTIPRKSAKTGSTSTTD